MIAFHRKPLCFVVWSCFAVLFGRSVAAADDQIKGEPVEQLSLEGFGDVEAALDVLGTIGEQIRQMRNNGELDIVEYNKPAQGTIKYKGSHDSDTIAVDAGGSSFAEIVATLYHEFAHLQNARQAGTSQDPTTPIDDDDDLSERVDKVCNHAQIHAQTAWFMCNAVCENAFLQWSDIQSTIEEARRSAKDCADAHTFLLNDNPPDIPLPEADDCCPQYP